MRIILASIVAACVMTVLAGLGLYLSQKPIYEAEAMPTVRVGDPGSNLVGDDWSGNPKPDRKTHAAAEGSGMDSKIDNRVPGRTSSSKGS